MLPITLRALRTSVWLTWFAATLGLVILIVLPHALPAVGRHAYIVRGGSMEPAIPLGSLVVVEQVPADEVRVGDVITFHIGNGIIVTHRVLEVAQGSEIAFTTRGDASGSVDPVDIPASAVEGTVELILPGAGYLLTALGSTSGVLASMGLLGSLLMAGFFADELAATLLRSAKRKPVAELVR